MHCQSQVARNETANFSPLIFDTAIVVSEISKLGKVHNLVYKVDCHFKKTKRDRKEHFFFFFNYSH